MLLCMLLLIIIIIKHTAQLDFEQELPLIHSVYAAGTPVLELWHFKVLYTEKLILYLGFGQIK